MQSVAPHPYLCWRKRGWHLWAVQDGLTHIYTHLAICKQLWLNEACSSSSSVLLERTMKHQAAVYVHIGSCSCDRMLQAYEQQ